jgi:hypothetical protein
MPNPFENPELFGISGDPLADASPSAPGYTPAPARDARVDSLASDVESLGKKINTIIAHLKKQEQIREQRPQPTFTTQPVPPEPVHIRTEDARARTARKPYTIRLPQTKNAWPYFQVVAFVALSLAVVFLLFRGQPDPGSEDNQLRAAYTRSVQAVKAGSQSLSVDLMDLAKQVREQQLSQEKLDEGLKSSIQRAMLIAGEGPMKALNEIQPWDPQTVAGRLESSADAFGDIAKSIERLKAP